MSSSATSAPSSGIPKALGFGLLIGGLAAAITAIVIFVRNDRNKTNPAYKKPSWLNVAWAGIIAFIVAFALSELKHRIQQKDLYKSASGSLQKWINTNAPTPQPSVASA